MTNLENEIAKLKAKIRARKGKPAYRDNVPMLEAQLERYEGVQRMIEEAQNEGS